MYENFTKFSKIFYVTVKEKLCLSWTIFCPPLSTQEGTKATGLVNTYEWIHTMLMRLYGALPLVDTARIHQSALAGEWRHLFLHMTAPGTFAGWERNDLLDCSVRMMPGHLALCLMSSAWRFIQTCRWIQVRRDCGTWCFIYRRRPADYVRPPSTGRDG